MHVISVNDNFMVECLGLEKESGTEGDAQELVYSLQVQETICTALHTNLHSPVTIFIYSHILLTRRKSLLVEYLSIVSKYFYLGHFQTKTKPWTLVEDLYFC